MKKIIPFCASLAFVLGVSGGANAAIENNFGTLMVPANIIDGNTPPGCGGAMQPACDLGFTDQWLFKVNIPANLVDLNAILNLGPPNIALGTFGVELWREIPPPSLLVGSDPPVKDPALIGIPLAVGIQGMGAAANQWTLAFSGLSTGIQYFIEVFGDTTNTAGGNYSIQLAVSAVPLPPAVVLFLSALAGLAGFSRIRRRKAVTA